MDHRAENKQEKNQKYAAENQEQTEYNFVREVIKARPLDRRLVVRRLVIWAALAVAAGIIAAFVFVKMVPVARNLLGSGEKARKVTIPSEEDPDLNTDTNSAADTNANPENSPETLVASSSDSEQTAEITPTPTPEASLTLEDYRQIYKDMLTVAEEARQALVTVTGISSKMDYFNQNYENQNQVSGLLVADNGQNLFILTEYRALENVEKIQVTFCDGTMADASFQRRDINTGLAIVRVEAASLEDSVRECLTLAPLGSSYNVNQGDPILALGSPMGYSDSLSYGIVTSTSHKVSALDTEYDLLLTDMLGSKEGSGILVNLEGEIVAVISQSHSSEDKNVITGLAISKLKELIESLSNNEGQSYIGIRGQNVTAQISRKTGLPIGVLVTGVQADSPAMLSGIKEQDVIVKLEDETMTSIRQYHDRLSKLEPGQEVKITAMRQGTEGYAEVEFKVTVSEI